MIFRMILISSLSIQLFACASDVERPDHSKPAIESKDFLEPTDKKSPCTGPDAPLACALKG